MRSVYPFWRLVSISVGSVMLVSGGAFAQTSLLPGGAPRAADFLSARQSDAASAVDSLRGLDSLLQRLTALDGAGTRRANGLGPITGAATTFTYQGGGTTAVPTSGNFSGANFTPTLGATASATPVSTNADTLVFNFNGNSAYAATDDFTSPVNLQTLTIGSGSGGSYITLAAGSGSANNTLAFSNTTANALNLNSSNTSVSIALNLTLAGPLTVSGPGDAVLSGVISGSGSLIMNNSQVVSLTGANTYTGGTMISSGSVEVGIYKGAANTASLGPGNVTISSGAAFGGGIVYYAASSAGSSPATVITNNNGDIYFNDSSTAGRSTINNFYGVVFYDSSTAGSSTINNNNPASNLSSITFLDSSSAGSSTINNNAYVDFRNTSTANNATIINNANAYGHLDLSGLTAGAGLSIGSLSGSGVVFLGSQTLTVDGLASNPSTTISGVIQDGGDFGGTGGSLIKAGTGTLTLSGANTYTGSTSIAAGVLLLGNRLALQNSTLAYTAGGTLSFGSLTSATLGGLTGSKSLPLVNASSAAVALTVGNNNGSTQYDGIFSGSGSLLKAGTGTLALTGANTYTGGTLVGAGKVVGGGTALGTGAVTVAGGATLGVGEALNGTGIPIATSSLSASSLAVTLGSATPLLTFNLGASGTSDVLNLTSTTATDLTYSGSGTFGVAFSSATGKSLSAGTYTLITFASPEASTSAPAIGNFQAFAQNNLARIGGGSFSYQTNAANNITALLFNITSADATPEPSSVALLLTLGLPGALMAGGVAARRSRREDGAVRAPSAQ